MVVAAIDEAHAAEIEPRWQATSALHREVVVDGVDGMGGRGLLDVVPQGAAYKVEDADFYRQGGAYPVVFDAELRMVLRRIFGQLHADEVGLHVAVDNEVERGDRRIVVHIPRAELQSVAAFAELGQPESHRSRGVAADVEPEMVVEVVGLLRFAVDNECQVVPNAAARDVDAVAIVERCHKHWRGVHATSRPKRGVVEVASDGGSDAITGG